jgi:hypothetical protein
MYRYRIIKKLILLLQKYHRRWKPTRTCPNISPGTPERELFNDIDPAFVVMI